MALTAGTRLGPYEIAQAAGFSTNAPREGERPFNLIITSGIIRLEGEPYLPTSSATIFSRSRA